MRDSTKRRRPSLHPFNHEGHEQEAAEGEAVQERNVGTEEELEADANEGVVGGEYAEEGELQDTRAEASSAQVELIHGDLIHGFDDSKLPEAHPRHGHQRRENRRSRPTTQA